MIAVLQTALQTETPHIGAGGPFVAIAITVAVVAILLAVAINWLTEFRHPSPPSEKEWDELLASQALGVDDPRTEKAYAEVQARARALGVTPPA